MSTGAVVRPPKARRFIRWQTLILGSVAAVVGLLLILQPQLLGLVVLQILAVLWVAAGVIALLETLVFRRGPWVWHIVAGVLGIGIGLMVLAQPTLATVLTLTTLYLVAAVTTLALGGVEIIEGLTGERDWEQVIVGVMMVIVAVLLAMFPQTGAAILVRVIGFTAIAFGILVMGLSLFSHTQSQAKR
jgi:uncharacterized membrane protein HdeD (DUF308 family)